MARACQGGQSAAGRAGQMRPTLLPCWHCHAGIMRLDLVGNHRYSGTWNQVEESTDPAHQGKLEPKPS